MNDTDHYYLQRQYWDSLKSTLQQVGWVSEELDTVLIRQSRYSERQAYRKITEEERPVPFHDKASDLAHDLNGLLNEWIHRVCAARVVEWPGFMRTPQAAHWMSNHHVYLALTDGADQFFADLKDVVKQCTRLVDRPPGTVYAGPCPSKGSGTWCGDLYVRPGATNVKCEHCDKTWDVSELREFMMEDARQTLGTAAELAGILPWFMDEPINRKRISYLVRRKLVTPRPSVDGVERYQLGEIVDAHNMLIAHKNSA